NGNPLAALRSILLLIGNQGADTGIGEDFQQYRIGYAAVDDDGTADATLNGVQSATDLRQHAAVDGAIGDQLVDLGGAQAGEHVAFLVHQAGDVGGQHQFLGLQRFGHLAGNKIGIDVVGLAVLAHADGGDDRDEI